MSDTVKEKIEKGTIEEQLYYTPIRIAEALEAIADQLMLIERAIRNK
jgi:hypothetical protein